MLSTAYVCEQQQPFILSKPSSAVYKVFQRVENNLLFNIYILCRLWLTCCPVLVYKLPKDIMNEFKSVKHL